MLTQVQFKRLRPEAKMPRRAYDSAGYDLWPMREGIILPRSRAAVLLGFTTAFLPGYAAVIDDRGSTGFAGITHLAGVIDADYRGEWVLILYNTSIASFRYSPDKAIAQVMFLKVEQPEFLEVETLPESARGDGKFGSSGH